MSGHHAGLAEISKEFWKRGWRVQVQDSNLPTGSSRSQAIYRPDILVKDEDGQIAWVVEVETSHAIEAISKL